MRISVLSFNSFSSLVLREKGSLDSYAPTFCCKRPSISAEERLCCIPGSLLLTCSPWTSINLGACKKCRPSGPSHIHRIKTSISPGFSGLVCVPLTVCEALAQTLLSEIRGPSRMKTGNSLRDLDLIGDAGWRVLVEGRGRGRKGRNERGPGRRCQVPTKANFARLKMHFAPSSAFKHVQGHCNTGFLTNTASALMPFHVFQSTGVCVIRKTATDFLQHTSWLIPLDSREEKEGGGERKRKKGKDKEREEGREASHSEWTQNRWQRIQKQDKARTVSFTYIHSFIHSTLFITQGDIREQSPCSSGFLLSTGYT